jgi:hypothetical protein
MSLEVEWIAESNADGAWGSVLQTSLRSVKLPLPVDHRVYGDVRLRMALPGRARMFYARLRPVGGDRPNVYRFVDVAAGELLLLASALVERHGLSVIPALARVDPGW